MVEEEWLIGGQENIQVEEARGEDENNEDEPGDF
jgi:hypothetical protein